MNPQVSQLKERKLIKELQILDQSFVRDGMKIFPCAPDIKRTHKYWIQFLLKKMKIFIDQYKNHLGLSLFCNIWV